MKKLIIIFIPLYFIFNFGYSQDSINNSEKLSSLCKIWGFLKYYHPKVSKGKYDWDNELVKKILLVKNANSKDEINKIYLNWINNLGKIKHFQKSSDVTNKLKNNLDFKWIDDTTVFSKELILILNYIKENGAKRNRYYTRFKWTIYPSFKHEKEYNEMLYPNNEFRLLSLFKFWNIINYFYPYRYLTDQNWNDVLTEMIPKFISPKDTIEYQLAILELSAKLNDSHAGNYFTKYTVKYFGLNRPPFICRMIDNEAVVTAFLDDTLANENGVEIGDVIVDYNNEDISDLIKEKEKYISASNEPTKFKNLLLILFNSNLDSAQITLEREGKLISKTINLYHYSRYNYTVSTKKDSIKKLDSNNIGYVNMGKLKGKYVKEAMRKMMCKKAIIFDLRNGSYGTMFLIPKYINKEKLPFAKFIVPDFKNPGAFKWYTTYRCGKNNNKNYYKGKIVLLINENTLSHDELNCMALQTSPNVVCVGSQTAGADGNVKSIIFPGGYYVFYTGVGVYYPNNKETQRIGIIPDIVVKPTIDGIKNKKDEILDKAIDYINYSN